MPSDLLRYLPEVLKEVREFKALAEAESPETDILWQAVEDVLSDQFVEDSTLRGVKRWESILKVVPKSADTLEVRQFRILSRLNENIPYTYRSLEQQLATLCGPDGYQIILDNGNYTLKVRVELAAKQKFEEVESLVKRTAPANLILSVSLLYNQHSLLADYTHAYLSQFTHGQLRKDPLVEA